MLHTVLRRRANGESVEQIRPDLIIPTGKRKGQHPSPASIYRALAEHEKGAGVPRGHRPSPRRLRRPPDEYLTARSSLVSHIRPIFGGYYGDPDLAATLRKSWNVDFDDAGQIGRRYRRQDEISAHRSA